MAIHWKNTGEDDGDSNPWMGRALGLLGIILGYAIYEAVPYIL